jgi:tungstate transport system ATP-binding protein
LAEILFPVEARGLGVRIGGHDAIKEIDITLEGRARTVILGANGAGKSVLLRALHGLIAPTSGTLRWAGSAHRPNSQAMVFQRPVMLRRSTRGNIEYALAVNGLDDAACELRAREAMEHVGLSHVAERQARVLSGGEQQRIALARAWALKPRLLYLDEPTASLDPSAAAEVERIIGRIHATGTSVVMTTHNLGLARRFADEIVFLHEGRITERSPAERFFKEPASNEARWFLQGELPWNTASPAI